MAADLSIRPGAESDLERVAAIKVVSWADTYTGLIPPHVLEPFLDPHHQLAELREAVAAPDAVFLVAERAGRVVGFVLAYLDREPEPWLESLHVEGEVRGQGAGTRMMREVALLAVAKGRRTMRLGVVTGNAGASRLYRRLGADLVAREPVTWALGVDHEIYRWADLAELAGPL